MEYWKNCNLTNIKYTTYTVGRKDKRRIYRDVSFSFDIETTNLRYNDEPVAFMYIWQCAINGKAYYGRTWQEFKEFFRKINEWLGNDFIICFVHNLKFEFSFLLGEIFNEISECFLLDERTPAKFLYNNIEFRCSYLLSNKSLDSLANDYCVIYKKLKGNLDYSKIRHCGTKLDSNELSYCANDVLILNEWYERYIRPVFLNNSGTKSIPLTSTGIVRNDCRNELKKSGNKDYKTKLKELYPSYDLYNFMLKVFMGGYVHANNIYTDIIIPKTGSYDLTSSYPASMLQGYYPMSAFILCNKGEEMNRSKFCYMIKIKITNLKAKNYMTIISKSKCESIEGGHYDNGRLISAKSLITYITDIDLEIFQMYYNFNFEIITMYKSVKGKLPKFLIKTLFKYYQAKKQLKGVSGQEVNYMCSKNQLNSLYGMMVTKLLRKTYKLDGNKVVLDDSVSNFENNRNNINNFLAFQWGIWVVCISRFSLLSTVKKVEHWVVYCDTDSIKYIPNNKINKVIADYNEECLKKTRIACEYYSIDFNTMSDIGLWDFEGYCAFKTLGCKRYLKNDGSYHLTCSGINNQALNKCNFNNQFQAFSDGLVIPPDKSGRMVSHYSKDNSPKRIIVGDYLGNEKTMTITSYCAMFPSEYKLKMSDDYSQLLDLLQRERK